MYLPMTANIKESFSFKGELTVEEDLTVEGYVEGKIELKDHNLWIGPHGKVNAVIHEKMYSLQEMSLGKSQQARWWKSNSQAPSSRDALIRKQG